MLMKVVPMLSLARIALLTDCDVHDLCELHLANVDAYDVARAERYGLRWQPEQIADQRDRIALDAVTHEMCAQAFDALGYLLSTIGDASGLAADRVRLASFAAMRVLVCEGHKALRERVAALRAADAQRTDERP